MEILPELQERFNALKGLAGLSAKNLDAKKVHFIRVSARRLRTLVEIIQVDESLPKLTKAARKLKRVTNVMGEIRQYDVLAQLLKESYQKKFPLVVKKLLKKAAQARKKSVKIVFKKSNSKITKKINILADTLKEFSAKDLKFSFEKALNQKEKISRKALGVYQKKSDVVHLHEYRIATKKWRYVCELAEMYGIASATSAASLKVLQDELGECLDHEASLQVLKDLDDKKSKQLRRAIQKDLNQMMSKILSKNSHQPKVKVRKHFPLRLKDHGTVLTQGKLKMIRSLKPIKRVA